MNPQVSGSTPAVEPAHTLDYVQDVVLNLQLVAQSSGETEVAEQLARVYEVARRRKDRAVAAGGHSRKD